MSITNTLDIQKTLTKRKFKIVKLFEKAHKPNSMVYYKSIPLPFYDQLLFNKDSGVNVMMIYIDKKVLNNKERDNVLKTYASLLPNSDLKT